MRIGHRSLFLENGRRVVTRAEVQKQESRMKVPSYLHTIRRYRQNIFALESYVLRLITALV